MKHAKSWVAGLLLLVVLVCTWPALPALITGELLVGRTFDLHGTVWFLSATPRLWPDLFDPLTGAPAGLSLRHADSFSLLLLAPLVALIGAARVHCLLMILGPWLTACAGAHFARVVGARDPWTILAGLGAGLGPLTATALLEGHVYLALAPGLPMLAAAWWQSTGPDAHWRSGLASGLWFGLCLWTTAYQGMAAAALILALGGVALLANRGRLSWGPIGVAAIAALLVGLPYLWLFLGGDAGGLGEVLANRGSPLGMLRTRAADAVALAAATPGRDAWEHGVGFSLPATLSALVLVGPWVLRGRSRAAGLAVATGLCLLLPMGAQLGPLPLPLALLEDTGWAGLVRFPMRLGMGVFVLGGALGAWVATAIAAQRGGWAWALMATTAIDLLAFQALPWRQQHHMAAAPSAYSSGTGPVLELFPDVPTWEYELSGWFTALPCADQAIHGRALADDCIEANPAANPRHQHLATLVPLLLTEDAAGAEARLGAWGMPSLAFHPDLFHPTDRSRIQATLGLLDPDPVVSTDGGAHVQLYTLQGAR